MKKIIILFVLLSCIGLWKLLQDNNISVNNALPGPTPSSFLNADGLDTQEKTEVTHNTIDYTIYYSKLTDKTIAVIPNFQEKKGADTIARKHNCTISSSGGFYTEQDTPLGLFKINNKIIGTEKEVTNLINGFFSVDTDGKPHVGQEYSPDSPTIIQSGPYFSSGNEISTVNDKPARRIVIIETTKGDYYLTAITTSDLVSSGPHLSDLPVILFSISEPFTVKQALNMDGGAASFYKDESGFSLSELTRIGSVICAIK